MWLMETHTHRAISLLSWTAARLLWGRMKQNNLSYGSSFLLSFCCPYPSFGSGLIWSDTKMPFVCFGMRCRSNWEHNSSCFVPTLFHHLPWHRHLSSLSAHWLLWLCHHHCHPSALNAVTAHFRFHITVLIINVAFATDRRNPSVDVPSSDARSPMNTDDLAAWVHKLKLMRACWRHWHAKFRSRLTRIIFWDKMSVTH